MKRFLKRIYSFLIILAFLAIVYASFNYVLDPFGAFGDVFFKMDNYNSSKNGRIAKVAYLDKNYKNFDSYIVGGSKSGALLPSFMEKYLPNLKFYNLNMIGGRFYDYEKTIQYIVKNYRVNNIVLQISHLEASKPDTSSGITGILHGKLQSEFPILFYLRLLFSNPIYAMDKLNIILQGKAEETEKSSFYDLKSGAYNYEKVESEIKSDPETFFSNRKSFPGKEPVLKKTYYDYNSEVLKRIVEFCEENHVSLLIISSPTYKDEMASYPRYEWKKFKARIAEFTDYWDFSGNNTINNDKTNFNNNNHYRVTVARMIMARIFNDKSVKVPGDFGRFIKKAT